MAATRARSAQGASKLPRQAGLIAGPGTRGAFLHGEPLLAGTVVLAGETVNTAAGGVLVLASSSASGGIIQLAGGATATVGADGAVTLHQGNALVAGPLAVVTPQGQRFRPTSSQAVLVVNVAPGGSRVGAISGQISTYAGGQPPMVLHAGEAVAVTGGGGTGPPLVQPVGLATLSRPDPVAAMPRSISASPSG
ncbi:MAG: hypothetical protein ACRD1A_08275 [Terriglobales bacterium]